MKVAHSTTRPPDAAFSLVEMLVVVAIASIVLALSFPMIGAMQRDSSASNGINTITVAIPSARRYATADVSFPLDLVRDNPSVPSSIGDQPGIYSGCAAVFTPAGEIRLTRNNPGATSSDFFDPPFFLERHGPRVVDVQAGSGLPHQEFNGFTDLKVDYLLLPSDTGVAGINRVSGGNPLTANPTEPPLLLPPPFAVWYNQSGYLVATGWDLANNRLNEFEFVYYDGNYDGNYTVYGSRSFRGTVSNYDPDEFNPNAGKFIRTNWNNNAEKYELPFEALEAVVGVYVYSRAAFQEANDIWQAEGYNAKYDEVATPPWTETSSQANEDRWRWLKENGEMVMFSRQTGAIMRDRNE
jgi:prepilin-type N-terminal cleavage/methylation domain-containing protein